MQMLQGLEGLGGNGYSAPTSLLQMLLGQLEGQMQTSMGGLQSEVETQAQALGAAIGEVLADLLGVGGESSGDPDSLRDSFSDLGDEVDDLSRGDDGALGRLGDKSLETAGKLDGLGGSAERLAAALDAAAASAYSAAGGSAGLGLSLADLLYQLTLAQTRSTAATTQAQVFS
jgi:hypothetical protein